jgi:hypothetical protein
MCPSEQACWVLAAETERRTREIEVIMVTKVGDIDASRECLDCGKKEAAGETGARWCDTHNGWLCKGHAEFHSCFAQVTVRPASGVLSEGAPAGQQPTKPSVSPGKVGHWNHPDKE